MANVYKSVRTVVQEMCDDFKAITGVTLTPDMKDNTHVIKFYSFAGALSAKYSESQRTLNDIFPQTASEEGLLKHLSTRSLPTRIQPQKSNGQITFTLTGAATVSAGTQVRRKSNGDLYEVITGGSLGGAGDLTLFCNSVETGNDQNIDADDGEPFELVTAIANVNTDCESASKFLDGRDLETVEEMVLRILEHDRDDNTGGNAAAYEAWAKEASAEVVTAKCIRLVRGPDTVDILITSGTTDIEAAVENGDVVSRLPSAPLIATVQAYIEALNPVTDDVLVVAPTEQNFNATIKYTPYEDTVANRSYLDDVILKVAKTYIYSAKPGDILKPTELERLIDQKIGDQLDERQVSNFNGGTTFFVVPNDKILTPNVITISAF